MLAEGGAGSWQGGLTIAPWCQREGERTDKERGAQRAGEWARARRVQRRVQRRVVRGRAGVEAVGVGGSGSQGGKERRSEGGWVSRQKRLVGKWQERFLTANWRQERGPGCVGEGDRGGFAKPKQTRSEVLDGGFHTIKSTVDGSVCGLLGCGLLVWPRSRRSCGRRSAGVRACGRAVSTCCCVRRASLPFVVVAARSSGFEAQMRLHCVPGASGLAPRSLIPSFPTTQSRPCYY
jgi:hypothetical protein